jgi:hypothetical protein
MGTHIEHFLNELNKDLKQADKLAEAGYEKDELRDLVTNVGASTEVFLKTAALPHLSPRTDFASCINALEAAGVSREGRETLHSLRTIYNESKHAPNYRPSVLGFQELLQKVIAVIRSLGARNLGLLNSPERLEHNRVLWLAVWDHYIGGDSEVHVIVPAKSGWPPDLDLVYIDFMAWDKVKSLLAQSGSLRPSRGLIPPDCLAQLAAEDDFREAVVFEGKYRRVIATLAAHERREDLLPSLRREDDWASMVQAFTLASIDAATAEEPLDGNWANAISKRAIDTYAVPPNFHLLSQHAQDFGRMLEQVPVPQRKMLNGPVWVSKEQFNNAETGALAKHPAVDVLVDGRGTVILRSTQ